MNPDEVGSTFDHFTFEEASIRSDYMTPAEFRWNLATARPVDADSRALLRQWQLWPQQEEPTEKRARHVPETRNAGQRPSLLCRNELNELMFFSFWNTNRSYLIYLDAQQQISVFIAVPATQTFEKE